MDGHYDMRHLKLLSGPNNKYKVVTCVTSRHGDSSSQKESGGNYKGLHINVDDQEVWVKLGPLLGGGSYMWSGC